MYKVLYLLSFMIHRHNQYKTGIQIPLGTSVGSGLCFSHYSCVVINVGAKIGKNFTIFQGCTVGSVRGPKGGVPTIGDNVVMCSGSKIIGNVKVGNNVMIGAGAVVVKNVPDNAVVVGIPARVVNYSGLEQVSYYKSNGYK